MPFRSLSRHAFALVLALAALGWAALAPAAGRAATTASAATSAAPAPATPRLDAATTKQIEQLIGTLRDTAARNRLIHDLDLLVAASKAAPPPPAAAPAPPPTLSARILQFLTEHVGVLGSQVTAVAGAFADLPQTWSWLRQQVADPANRIRWAELVLGLSLVVIVGWGLQQGISRGLRRIHAMFTARRPETLAGRLLLLLARLALDLVPITVFGVAGYTILSFVNPPLIVRLAALILVNAMILIQVVMALTRAVLAPATPTLRLPPITDETAAYIEIWVRRIAQTAIYGYFLGDAALLLGLPFSAEQAFLNLVGLVIALMLVILVLQNRAAIAALLRGHEDGEAAGEGGAGTRMAALRAVRRRTAEIWHILAIVYIAVIYAIWSLNVSGGFAFMARATVMSAVVLVLARLAFSLIDRTIDRGFAVSADLRRQFPNLEMRVNRYLPILEQVVKAVVWLIVVMSLLDAWGVDSFAWLDTPFGQRATSASVSIAIVLVLAVIVWEVMSNLIDTYLNGHGKRGHVARSARVRTLLPLLRNVLLVVLIVLVSLIVMSELGFDITPLLAGAGVIGLAIGFGSQTLVKDIITGLFILFEDTIQVGDVADLGSGHSGVVEAISIRTIRLRDGTGSIHTVPFSAVATVVNMTRDYANYLFTVNVAHREDVDEVMAVIREIGAGMQADPAYAHVILAPIDIWGVDGFTESAVVIKGQIRTPPSQQWGVGREFNRRLKKAFDARGIQMPHHTTTVYYGEDKEGEAPPLRVWIEEMPGVVDAAPEPAEPEPAESRGDRRRAGPPGDPAG